jgi:membrane protease YdiL (CAAX protease family)
MELMYSIGDSVNPSNTARKYIVTFLILTFLTSSVFWLLIHQAGDIRASNGLLNFCLMWCPGLSATLTTLIYQRNLKGLWSRPKPRSMLLLAYVVPLVYATLVYGGVWIAGLGVFTTHNLPPGQTLETFIWQAAVVGFFIALGSSIGEELGWRGLLAPQLAKITTFTKTSIFSGIVHTLWHVPLILFANYRSSTPIWFALTCFSIMVISFNFIAVWIRLRSGSFWPAAAMHASHSTLVQTLFGTLTSPLAITPYIVGEFGAGLALATAVLAYIFWKMRLPVGNEFSLQPQTT